MQQTNLDLSNPVQLIVFIITWFLMFGIYLTPSLISLIRKHTKKWFILLLNVCFGWTIIGWMGAFIWSLIDPKK